MDTNLPTTDNADPFAGADLRSASDFVHDEFTAFLTKLAADPRADGSDTILFSTSPRVIKNLLFNLVRERLTPDGQAFYDLMVDVIGEPASTVLTR